MSSVESSCFSVQNASTRGDSDKGLCRTRAAAPTAFSEIAGSNSLIVNPSSHASRPAREALDPGSRNIPVCDVDPVGPALTEEERSHRPRIVDRQAKKDECAAFLKWSADNPKADAQETTNAAHCRRTRRDHSGR
jgi:hypothetical protein